ncbi:MAG: hypothetical protein E7044_04370 [Lentisphaerae bacterium]|nr:hypothetical protein [Lentisphaerota bacterium]
MKRYFSFTLVEILAVTVLVSLLAAIGFAGYGYAMNASRRAATESLIQQISAGLENFKIKNGYYPYSESYQPIQISVSNDFIESITWGGSESDKKVVWAKSDSKTKTLLNTFIKVLDQEKLKKNIDGNGYLVDSWGGRIYYKYPGTFNKTGFDLIAPGEDGNFGKSGAGTPSTDPDDYKDSGEWACDDISNFMDK